MSRRVIQKFKIKATEYPLWYWVYVYDDRKKLVEDANNYKIYDNVEDCLAVCQPVRRIVIHKDGTEERYNNLGIIRILADAGSEITSHELLHASLDLYREAVGMADFGESCSEDEETLCYIHGQMFSMLVSKMYKYGVWGRGSTGQAKGKDTKLNETN